MASVQRVVRQAATLNVPGGDLAQHVRQRVADHLAGLGEELNGAYGDADATRAVVHARMAPLGEFLDAVGWGGDAPIEGDIELAALMSVTDDAIESLEDELLDDPEHTDTPSATLRARLALWRELRRANALAFRDHKMREAEESMRREQERVRRNIGNPREDDHAQLTHGITGSDEQERLRRKCLREIARWYDVTYDDSDDPLGVTRLLHEEAPGRWAAVLRHAHGPHRIDTFAGREEATVALAAGWPVWLPADLYDLDTGERYDLKVSVGTESPA